LFLSFKTIAQSNENEIVIASEKFTIQTIQEIKQLLQSKEGLTYKGFCEEHKVLLILIENNQYSVKHIIEIIQNLISNDIFIKEGGFDAVRKVCSDYEKIHLR
jgi:hypothetical protein